MRLLVYHLRKQEDRSVNDGNYLVGESSTGVLYYLKRTREYMSYVCQVVILLQCLICWTYYF
jgi:hypothetical protein